jgi:GNAT superfamily N-acetyltransferase
MRECGHEAGGAGRDDGDGDRADPADLAASAMCMPTMFSTGIHPDASLTHRLVCRQPSSQVPTRRELKETPIVSLLPNASSAPAAYQTDLSDATDAFHNAHHRHTAPAGVTVAAFDRLQGDGRTATGDVTRQYAAPVLSAEFEEVLKHSRRVEASGVDEAGVWPGGTWIRTRTLPLVYDANHVIVLEPGFGLSMGEVSAAANDIQAGLPNRIVEFVQCAATADLAAAFSSAGWVADPLGVMVRHREPDRRVDTSAVQVIDQAGMRSARTDALNAEVWALGDAVAQVREKQERVGRAVPTTHLAILEDGKVVSYCEVFHIGDAVAQIESVATLPAYRRRGLSRAVVSRALELTRDRRLVFLQMDPHDWPQQLYAKLGFDEIGRVLRFRRALPGSQ